MTVNAHDAEEQLRPYLGRVYEATDASKSHIVHTGTEPSYPLMKAQLIATTEALHKALELLGVQK